MDNQRFWNICAVRGQNAHQIRAGLAGDGAALKTADLDPERVAKWQRFAQKYQLIRCIDPNYPDKLWQLARPPKQLWCSGDIGLLERPITAIVGSRSASLHGIQMAQQVTSACADQVVISGGARGIDICAHQGSFPNTIAVMGGGLECLFPQSSLSLLRRIGREGLLISEQSPDTPPRAGLFPVRNRLIAALCDRLIVIEGTHQSGSLITANQALELGKDIWAVPGSPLSPLSSGPNRLIRDGAQPFTEPEDWQAKVCLVPNPEDPIAVALAGHSATPQELAAHLEWPLGQILSRLMELKIAGKVTVTAGRYAWRF